MSKESIIDFSKTTLIDPPEMGREALRDVKKGIDGTFRDFIRENGEWIEAAFDPLKWFLVWFSKPAGVHALGVISGDICGLGLCGFAQLEVITRRDYIVLNDRLAGHVGGCDGNPRHGLGCDHNLYRACYPDWHLDVAVGPRGAGYRADFGYYANCPSFVYLYPRGDAVGDWQSPRLAGGCDLRDCALGAVDEFGYSAGG